MKKKLVLVGPDAIKSILAGANFACDAIKRTYGPHGKNFASGIRGGAIKISNDGVSLARELVGAGNNEFEEMGIRAVSEACIKTNEIAGDGTTGAAVVLQVVLSELDRTLHLTDGVIGNKMAAEVIDQVKAEVKEVVKLLGDIKKDVTSKEDLVAVARVSGEYPALAEMIAEAQWEVGKYGTVTVEETNSAEDSVEFVYGIRLDNGYTNSRHINNLEKQTLELADVRVILTSHFFGGSIDPIIHIIKKMADDKAGDVLLMGRGFDDSVIGWATKQNQNSSLKVWPVNAPYTDMNEIMEDLAAITGARYINANERNLETMLIGDVGHASKAIFKRLEGLIAGKKAGTDEHIDKRVATRIEQLEEKLKGDVSPFEEKHIKTRLSQLRAGTAIVKVGAETEQERSHKKDKADDTVNAVRAALEEGTTAGGGLALMEVADRLPDTYLIKEALRAPYYQIKKMAPANFEIEPWVRDPLKVVRVGLEKACSIASSLATTEVAITWEREKPQYVTTVDNKIRETGDDE